MGSTKLVILFWVPINSDEQMKSFNLKSEEHKEKKEHSFCLLSSGLFKGNFIFIIVKGQMIELEYWCVYVEGQALFKSI